MMDEGSRARQLRRDERFPRVDVSTGTTLQNDVDTPRTRRGQPSPRARSRSAHHQQRHQEVGEARMVHCVKYPGQDLGATVKVLPAAAAAAAAASVNNRGIAPPLQGLQVSTVSGGGALSGSDLQAGVDVITAVNGTALGGTDNAMAVFERAVAEGAN